MLDGQLGDYNYNTAFPTSIGEGLRERAKTSPMIPTGRDCQGKDKKKTGKTGQNR